MPVDPRYVVPWMVYEITVRTIQGRLLLRPSRRCNDLIVGVVGRAQQLYPEVRLHGEFVLPTHLTMLVSVRDVQDLASFMGFIDGNTSKEIGRLHHWGGSMWGRAYTHIAVVDEAAQIESMAYLLGQACKAGLVPRVLDWPGVHCGDALSTGKPQTGIWVDRTRAYRLRRRGQKISNRAVEEEVTVRYAPLPVWEHLLPEDYQKNIVRLIRRVERAAQATHERFMGSARILRQSPHARARGLVRSPRPVCHASTLAGWQAYRDARRAFVRAYRQVFSGCWVAPEVVRLPVPCFAPPAKMAA